MKLTVKWIHRNVTSGTKETSRKLEKNKLQSFCRWASHCSLKIKECEMATTLWIMTTAVTYACKTLLCSDVNCSQIHVNWKLFMTKTTQFTQDKRRLHCTWKHDRLKTSKKLNLQFFHMNFPHNVSFVVRSSRREWKFFFCKFNLSNEASFIFVL